MIRSSRLYGRRNEKRGEKKREGRLLSQNLWLRSLIIHFLMELYNASYTHWHFRAVYLMVISIDFSNFQLCHKGKSFNVPGPRSLQDKDNNSSEDIY